MGLWRKKSFGGFVAKRKKTLKCKHRSESVITYFSIWIPFCLNDKLQITVL